MKCPYLKSGMFNTWLCKCATYPGDKTEANQITFIDRDYVKNYCLNNYCELANGSCPSCGAPAPADRQFCRICGYY